MLSKEHKQQILRSFELVNSGDVSVIQFQDANVVMLTKSAYERMQYVNYASNIEFDHPELPFCSG